jgi:hypothetical protein
MKNRRIFMAFLAGTLLGAVGAVVGPPLLSPHLPAAIAGRGVRVEGPVVAKSRESGRLLLKVVGREGAVLVTITKRTDEIDMLVETGDSVAFLVREYRPFVSDPDIAGVYKLSERTLQEAAAPTEAPAEPVVGKAQPAAARADSVEAEQAPAKADSLEVDPASAKPDTLVDRSAQAGRSTERGPFHR